MSLITNEKDSDMAYTDLDIAAAIEQGFKPGKALADALATLAAYDAQENGREAADIRQKLITSASAKESAELLGRLADIEVRKNALVGMSLRRSLNERLEREWNAVRVGFADDYLFDKVAQFDAVNEAAKSVPMALAADISAALDLPAEQATSAVHLHTAVKALNESISTAGRFGFVKTPGFGIRAVGQAAKWFAAIKLLAEWTDFSGDFREAFDLIQPLRRNLRSGSGMMTEDDPYPLLSTVGAVLVSQAGLKFVNRSVVERQAAVQRVADDSVNWALGGTDPETGKPRLISTAEVADKARQERALATKRQLMIAQAQARGVDVNV
jgi:hypothetical protein